MTGWPAWATENVEVREPDSGWQEWGDRERALLEATIGAWLVTPIEHVGSTAVPNLCAKPILDFQAAVTNLDCAADIAAALAPSGWHYVPPELDARPWRRFLVKVAQGRRVAHLETSLPLSSGRVAMTAQRVWTIRSGIGDRMAQGSVDGLGEPVVADWLYRSQFETGTSNGGLAAHRVAIGGPVERRAPTTLPSSSRITWESRMPA